MLVAIGCSPSTVKTGSSETGGSSGDGGSTGNGGSTGSGGSKGNGGSTGNGGTTGSGGSTGDEPDASISTGRRGGSGGSGGTTGSGGRGGAGTGGSSGADAGSGGKGGSGGRDAGTGSGGTGGSTGAGGTTGAGCDAPGLNWKTANKTWYTSYPAPGSEECIVYSGCQYQGMFQACNGTKSKAWVMSHNIVSFFPLGNMQLHDVCLKSGTKTIVVTVYDTCGDNDCNGCCTLNKGKADALIDLESFTNDRFGIDDMLIQWADLGPTKTGGCNSPP
jgi:hypothetical protein